MTEVETAVRTAEAGLDALEPLAALARRVFERELDIGVAARLGEETAEFRARFEPGRDFVLAASADGTLAGGLLAGHQPGPAAGVAQLSWLVVAPEFRRRGLGRRLLSEAVEACRARRVAAVRTRCIVHRSAPVRLYWDLGFKVVALQGLPYEGVPRETVVFEKRLTLPQASA